MWVIGNFLLPCKNSKFCNLEFLLSVGYLQTAEMSDDGLSIFSCTYLSKCVCPFHICVDRLE